MALKNHLSKYGAQALSSICPGCGADDVSQVETLDGKLACVCRACGQSWVAEYSPAARRTAQEAAGRVEMPSGTTDAEVAPERAKSRNLAELPDALTPKQLNDLLPGLDRDDLYARLNAYDDWRRTQAHGVPGLPMPPADLWDTMIPCHRFGGTMGHDGLLRGGRFMVPKSVVVRWFFDLREGEGMTEDDGSGG